MTPLEIRIALLKAGRTQADVARSVDPPVYRTAVHQVINKKIVSARIMYAVADAIGCDVKIVFPEYFLKDALSAHK